MVNYKTKYLKYKIKYEKLYGGMNIGNQDLEKNGSRYTNASVIIGEIREGMKDRDIAKLIGNIIRYNSSTHEFLVKLDHNGSKIFIKPEKIKIIEYDKNYELHGDLNLIMSHWRE